MSLIRLSFCNERKFFFSCFQITVLLLKEREYRTSIYFWYFQNCKIKSFFLIIDKRLRFLFFLVDINLYGIVDY